MSLCGEKGGVEIKTNMVFLSINRGVIEYNDVVSNETCEVCTF